MVTDEIIKKIAEQNGLPKEKLEQALVEMSEGKKTEINIVDLLKEIPKERIKQDKEFEQIYKMLKTIFEE